MARAEDIIDTIKRARVGQYVVMALDGGRKAKSFIDGLTAEEEMPSVPSFKS